LFCIVQQQRRNTELRAVRVRRTLCVQFSHLFSSQIRGITKEWVHTPVGFHEEIQKNPECRSNGIVCQYKSTSWQKQLSCRSIGGSQVGFRDSASAL
jgi:hypothetical protein